MYVHINIHMRLVACTPKLHHAEHIPEVHEQWGLNIGCRACETMHIETKRVSEHMLLPECAESAVLHRNLAKLFSDMQTGSYTPVHLINPKPLPTEHGFCLQAMGYGCSMGVAAFVHVALWACQLYAKVSCKEWALTEKIQVAAAENLASHLPYTVLTRGTILPIFRL